MKLNTKSPAVTVQVSVLPDRWRARIAVLTVFFSTASFVQAQDYSWNYNGSTASSNTWSKTTSWTPTAPTGGPTGAGKYVLFGNNISANRSITLNISGDTSSTTKTVGRLDIGDSDGSNSFTISAGSGGGILNFNGNGVNAQLNQLSTSAGDTISAPSTLSTSLDISNASTVVLTLGGGLSSVATSGTQNISVLSGDVTLGSISSANVIADGATGGKIAIIKSGTGTLSVQTSSNTYTGGTFINGGIVSINKSNSLGADGASVTLGTNGGGAASLLTSSTSATPNLAITVASGATGTLSLGSNSTNATAASTYSGTILLNGNVSLTSLNAGTAGLTFNSTISGVGSVSTGNTGIVVLASANTYQGGTTVSKGTLYANAGVSGTSSATGTNSVTVSGGTLGGNGNISGAVSVTSGTLLGGSGSTGTALTVSNNLTMSSGSIIGLTLGASGAHSTLIRGGGTWTFDPMQQFTLSGSPAVGFYDNIITGLASDPGSEGSWTVTNNGFAETFTYDGGAGAGNIDLTITSVPEPATILGGLLTAGLLGYRQRRRVRGWFGHRRALAVC